MGVNFTCDFCNVEQVDILQSKGKQELVYPKSFVKNKKKASPRFKYRGENCIKNGVNTTPDGWTIHSAKEIKKFEVNSEHIPSGTNEGLHTRGDDRVEKSA